MHVGFILKPSRLFPYRSQKYTDTRIHLFARNFFLDKVANLCFFRSPIFESIQKKTVSNWKALRQWQINRTKVAIRLFAMRVGFILKPTAYSRTAHKNRRDFESKETFPPCNFFVLLLEVSEIFLVFCIDFLFLIDSEKEKKSPLKSTTTVTVLSDVHEQNCFAAPSRLVA